MAEVKTLDGKDVLRDKNGVPIDSSLFENDPLPMQPMSDEQVLADMKRLGLDIYIPKKD